jgi:hypothetical protein
VRRPRGGRRCAPLGSRPSLGGDEELLEVIGERVLFPALEPVNGAVAITQLAPRWRASVGATATRLIGRFAKR